MLASRLALLLVASRSRSVANPVPSQIGLHPIDQVEVRFAARRVEVHELRENVEGAFHDLGLSVASARPSPASPSPAPRPPCREYVLVF
jgi:hypothetical protein